METRNVVRNIAYDEINNEHYYLILKTKKGYWQNPQGGIDEGESEIEAMIRETEEETQLKVTTTFENTKTKIQYPTERKGEQIHTKLTAYASRIDSTKPIKLSKEDGHTEYKWIREEEAEKYLTRYPEQLPLFKEVLKKFKENQN